MSGAATGDDKRIALAAVVVSGVIGLASPIIACQSNRDSAKDAQRAQENTARVALVTSDTRELRKLMDTSLKDLVRLRAAAVGKRIEWLKDSSRSGGGMTARTGQESQEPLAEAQGRLNRAFTQSRADGDRLWVRVGQRDVHNAYWVAYHEYGEVGACTRSDAERSAQRQMIVRALLKQGKRWGQQFRNLAFNRVRAEPRPGETSARVKPSDLPGAGFGRKLDEADYLECSDFAKARRAVRSHADESDLTVDRAYCRFEPKRREFPCEVGYIGGSTATVTVSKDRDKRFEVTDSQPSRGP
jgi:hypothetical protein